MTTPPPTQAPIPTITLQLGGLTGGILTLGKSVTAQGHRDARASPALALYGGRDCVTFRAGRWLALASLTTTISASDTYCATYTPAGWGSYRMKATIARTATSTGLRALG